MTWVEEHDTPGRAVRALLLAFPRLLVRQFVDVAVGIAAIGATLALTQVAIEQIPFLSVDVVGVLLNLLASVVLTAEFVFFASVTLVLWTYLLLTVVAAGNWEEFVDEGEMKEELEGDATGLELEFRRTATKFVGSLYKTIVVLLAAVPATLLVDAGFSWIAPVFLILVPLTELVVTRSGYASPGSILLILFILAISPVVFGLAVVTYTVSRTSDAVRRALELLYYVLTVPLEFQPENESLLDFVFSSDRHRLR